MLLFMSFMYSRKRTGPRSEQVHIYQHIHTFTLSISCAALYINIYYITRHITYVVTILIIQNNLTYTGCKALAIKHC